MTQEQWEMSISDLVDWANRELGLSEDDGSEVDNRPVTKRTIHYYISLGLLPPATGNRNQAVYGEEHRARLRAIKLMKSNYLPLKEIRARLKSMPLEQIRSLQLNADSAANAPDVRTLYSALTMRQPGQPEKGRARAASDKGFWSGQPQTPLPDGIPAPNPDSDLWRREEIAPGIEIHYKMTSDPRRALEIDRLILDARKRLKKTDPRLR